MIWYGKTTALNLKINSTVKQRAECVYTIRYSGVCSNRYVSQSNYINLGGIPFAVTLPNAPSVLGTDLMAAEESHKKLQEGV